MRMRKKIHKRIFRACVSHGVGIVLRNVKRKGTYVTYNY